MTTLQGPAVIPELLQNLFAKDQKRLDLELDRLIDANHQAGNPKQGFLLNGEYHSRIPLTQQNLMEKRMLAPELWEEGKDYVARKARLAQECLRIEAGLKMLLRDCHTQQDVRDALPEIVVDMVSGLTDLPRMREEGYTLKNNPMHFHDFKKTADLLAYYAVNQLLY